MEGKTSDWASATLKEVPFWREDMTPEEYEREREYHAKNFLTLVRNGKYVPLWKQDKK